MLARAVVIIIAILGGTGFSQLPELAQQYRQRLGGALDELNRIVDRFLADAHTEGLTGDEALKRLDQNADPLVRRQGWSMVDTIARRDRLILQKQAFEAAGPFARIISFVRHYDPTLVAGTLREFEPAVPVSMEGAVLAGFGFLAGLALAEAMRLLWRRWREGQNRAPPIPVPVGDRRRR